MRKAKFYKNALKKSAAFALSCSMVLGMAQIPSFDAFVKAKAETNFNYGESLQKSLIFYELQKSGVLDDGEEYNRNNWRADSCVNDGADNGVDLTGGLYDAGDNAKFNLPMSYTAATLAWSYLENTAAYKQSGQEKYLLHTIEWIDDYLVKCHPEENVYYYQVADGNKDHTFWGSAEVVEARMERPSYKVDNTEANGGSAVCGQTAAALAAASIALQESNPAKAATYLKHAKEIYTMAEEAKSDKGYTAANGFYQSWSGFYDELSWAAMWIYKATGDSAYLDKAEEYATHFEKEGQGATEVKYSYTHCWDDAHYGASYLLAMCDEAKNKEVYTQTVENNIHFWLDELDGKGGDQITYTEGGLAWLYQWGSIRYATTAGFLATIYSKWDKADPQLAEKAWTFAKQQADYALGSTGQSFQIGFGENYPLNPHHRTAHGAWGDSLEKDPMETRHLLVGALVGGPNKADDSSYEDDRGNYYTNEVADDYNAGFTGLVAAMYEEYGGTIDPSVSAVEEVGEELSIEAAINAEDKTNVINFVEIKTVVYNKTAWPARVTDKLAFRFYVDISDAIANGANPEDFEITSNYSMYEGTKLSALQPYDAANGIYYTEIDLSGANIYPGGQNYYRSEVQFRIKAPGKWDYSNSPSLQGLEGTNNQSMVSAENVALYDNGVLVFGQEPDGTKPAVTTQSRPTTQTPVTTTQGTQTTQTPVMTTQGTQNTEEPVVTTQGMQNTQTPVTTTQGMQNTQAPAVTTQGTQNTQVPATTQGTQNTQTPVTTTQGTQNTQTPVTTTQGTQNTQTPVTTTQGTQNTQTPVVTTQGTQNTQTPVATTQGTQNTQTPATTTQNNTAKVEMIILNQTSWVTQVGEKTTLNTTVLPANAVNEKLQWISSNSNIVRTDDYGNLEAVGTGSASVIVYAPNSGVNAECKVYVTEKNDNNTTQMPGNSDVTTQTPGDNNTTQIPSNDNATTQAPAGNNTTQIPSSGNATTQVPGSSNSTTQQNNSSVIPVEEIELMEENAVITVGGTDNISPAIFPYNATDKTITYTSSDSSIATVTADSMVVGLKPGIVQISMTANGGKTAVCQVTVKPSKVTGFKKTKVTSNKVTLKWKKQTGVTGYKVYQYNKKTKKYKLYKVVKKNQVTVKKLKKKTSYKFKVRPYATSSKVLYGAYSKVIVVKTKK